MATPIALFFLLTVASMRSNFSGSMVNANSEGDALIAFKQSLSDPTNALMNWDQNLVDPCTWFFVTCNDANQVTRLDLASRKLAGHLVPELGNLQYLQSLALYNNQLQGSIPTELGNLKSLVDLQLQDNNLTGTIPPSLGNLKSLVLLRLSNNHGLSGNVPQEVSNFQNLKVLDVSNTNVVRPSTPKTRSPPAPGDDNIPSKNMATPSIGLCRLFFLLPIVANTLSCLF